MTPNQFNAYTSGLWELYTMHLLPEVFDYPDYGGLNQIFYNGSPEACDAMQDIWEYLTAGRFLNYEMFADSYADVLHELGEEIV